uniref:Reticulocalbin-3 n=1 Tax=Timema tahoe TaxID=61484 RepID=A0A7R9IR53_9NEOP|nr:unnamed protein product [Timema tahoe]
MPISKGLFISVLVILGSPCSPSPASPHIHQHHREREQDGGYSPMDHNHIVDGVHYSEFDHEAILGSVKEAEEFDHLEPEEAKRRLSILVKKMDLDKDGGITRNELHAWILRSFSMLSGEESQDRFEDADENQDGVVTWGEYVADTYGIRESEEEDDEPEFGEDAEDKLINDDRIMFHAADGNNDGLLDKLEFVKFTHPEEHPEMLPVILEQTLAEKDLDQDGSISFQEYIGQREGRQHDKEWLVTEKDKFDQELDKDSDGRLNSAEILSWVVPSNDEIAQEEVDHLFASSDDDHNNVLSLNEVLDHHDIFVGSEATDYGDHLHNIHGFEDEL